MLIIKMEKFKYFFYIGLLRLKKRFYNKNIYRIMMIKWESVVEFSVYYC